MISIPHKARLIHTSYLLLLTALVFSISLSACAASDSYVRINGHTVEVEVVRSLEKQALGLMYRTEMADNHGMLFIYKRPVPLSFWMKNTRIPLDILFFDQDLKLINVSAETPPCRTPRCPGYSSSAPAQYVLEINAGLAQQWQIKAGDQLSLQLD